MLVFNRMPLSWESDVAFIQKDSCSSNDSTLCGFYFFNDSCSGYRKLVKVQLLKVL